MTITFVQVIERDTYPNRYEIQLATTSRWGFMKPKQTAPKTYQGCGLYWNHKTENGDVMVTGQLADLLFNITIVYESKRKLNFKNHE